MTKIFGIREADSILSRWEGNDVVLVVNQGNKELQEATLNELKDIKLALSKMSDLEFEEG